MSRVDRWAAIRRLRHRDHKADLAALPDPALRPGTDRLPQIRHIVLLMMENHSFDNYLGGLGHGDGARSGASMPTNLDRHGNPVLPFHLPTTTQTKDVPTQSWTAAHVQYDDGRNDGFVRSIEEAEPTADATLAMGYWDETDLPFYAALARTFALADRWFSSLLGPTFPNRRFLLAATANGLIDDQPISLVGYPKTGTIFDLLDRHGISWTNYHHVADWRVYAKRIMGGTGVQAARNVGLLVGSVLPQLAQIVEKDLQFTTDLYPLGLWRARGHLRHIDRFFRDAAAGTLPSISLVDPDFRTCSEENPQDIQIGEGFAAAVIDAVLSGPGWPHTLLLWFYDEHGGYADHVVPPPAVEPDGIRPRSLLSASRPLRWLLQRLGKWPEIEEKDSGAGRYDRLGFRVPAVAVSPFSRPGYVSSTVYDHTSALKLIEEKWNLPPLTARDAAATAPLDLLDLDQPVFSVPPPLPPPARPWRYDADPGPTGDT